ncbi:MAG: ACT domain-containing protein [Methanothrix sp.]|nr:ACT domain-containing protein [Methanothrix sp.]
MSISVCLEDSPGSLARLLAVLADHQANVVHIHHDRDDPRLPMGSIRVSLDLETRGLHHIKEVL